MMGIDPKQLMGEVIRPTLAFLGLGGTVAENLILGTIAQESKGGTYLRQLGGGPALGICQMEPITYLDIWGHFLTGARFGLLSSQLRKIAGVEDRYIVPKVECLIGNLNYSVAMCRVHYYRRPEALPSADLRQLALYWKKHYNTVKGGGTPAQFVQAFTSYTGSAGLV